MHVCTQRYRRGYLDPRKKLTWDSVSHYQSWRLTGLYVFCGLLFAVGFVIREIGAFDYENLIKFIISVCLIYAAPYVPCLSSVAPVSGDSS